MMAAILGRKLGMTELFDEAGHRVSVTLIEAEPNVVVHVKTRERDGYEALQVGVGAVKERRLPKPLRGVYVMPRAIGSIGSSNVARVWPGKRMPGRFGNERVTIRGLRVVKVEPERT